MVGEHQDLGRADGDLAQKGKHQAVTMRNQRLPHAKVGQRGRYENDGGFCDAGATCRRHATKVQRLRQQRSPLE